MLLASDRDRNRFAATVTELLDCLYERLPPCLWVLFGDRRLSWLMGSLSGRDELARLNLTEFSLCLLYTSDAADE